jgi:hypothetical protein
MSCLDENDVASYAGGELVGQALEVLEAHIGACELCRELVAEVLRSTAEKRRFIDRYVVLGVLGAGAAGLVYAAYDPKLNRKVALKVLHVRDEKTRQAMWIRLEREAMALAKVRHANVIGVFDVGTDNDLVYIALELAEGRTLDAHVQGQPQTRRFRRELERIFRDAALGLAAVHRAGLVHRDIKPKNIFIGDNGHVWLGDFGLARAFASELGADTGAGKLSLNVTHAGALVGTPAYMAPEQLRGESADARADVFALSAVMYEALCGVTPFSGDTVEARSASIARGPSEPTLPVPAWLRRMLRQGLAFDRDARTLTAERITTVLSRDTSARRRRFAVWAGGALVASALVIALYTFWLAGRIRCNALADSMTQTWNDGARSALSAKLGAAAPAIETALDRFAMQWQTVAERACRANAEAQMTCLSNARMQFRAELLALQSSATPGTEARLPALDVCADPEALLALQPLVEVSPEAATTTWDRLSASDHADILAGKSVLHREVNAQVLTVGVYTWVQNKSGGSDPEGAAAVFWDVEGQPNYLRPLGAFRYQIIAGRNTAAERIFMSGPGVSGPVSYVEDFLVYRVGADHYLTHFATVAFDQTPAPNDFRAFTGEAAFEHFPGDGGGALFTYSLAILLSPELARNTPLLLALDNLARRGIGVHVRRMEQGPTLTQRLRLRLAVFAQ